LITTNTPAYYAIFKQCNIMTALRVGYSARLKMIDNNKHSSLICNFIGSTI
jgi:hypothetical protein